MKRTSILFTMMMVFSMVYSQDKRAMKYARTITSKDLNAYLSVLASDSLQGRETGEPGQKKAAAYIADKFKSFGLEAPVETATGKSYYQTFPLKKHSYVTAYLRKGEEKKLNFEDFLFYSRAETQGEEYIDVVFSGVQTMDHLKNMDLSDKYIAIISEEMDNWRRVMADLKQLDAAGVFLIIEDDQRFDFMMTRYKKALSKEKLSLEVNNAANKIIIGNPALAEWVFDKDYSTLKSTGIGNSIRIVFNSDILVEDVMAENVLGFLPGTEKPEEVLVITAHYDHLGIDKDGQINNGADDDGSGTSSVMEIAQAFSIAASKGYKPKRSILFMTVSGEEKGLLGSEYYANHPIFPINKTVTNLNVDMVGRVDPKHESQPEYIYVIGADKLSRELHEISEKANKTYLNLELDYTYNADDDPNRYYYRSDHYNFAEKGIPVIFYFNGSHADYHKPSDTIEKINFEVMEKRARLVFFTAWELANRKNRVKLD